MKIAARNGVGAMIVQHILAGAMIVSHNADCGSVVEMVIDVLDQEWIIIRYVEARP